MVVDVLWPDNAPWWLNLFIWMATFWWYILIGFVPAFYIAVAKLFGMPLLQRWSNEVVIILKPSKVQFGKITNQMEPYIIKGKGMYWLDSPLSPKEYETPIEELPTKVQVKLDKLKERYNILSEKKGRTKKDDLEMKRLIRNADRIIKVNSLRVEPRNQLHIFTQPINQPVNNMERRQSKVNELLNNEANIKPIPNHGIWLLQNPRLHFHRHYQIQVNPDNTYQLIPVKQRQQFGIGFWHSLGIVMLKEVQQEEAKEMENSSGGKGPQLMQTTITTHTVIQQMKSIQEYQNYSASRAFSILKHRARIESPYGFKMWIEGAFDMRIILLLAGMVAGVALIFMMLHGGSSPGTPTTGAKPFL